MFGRKRSSSSGLIGFALSSALGGPRPRSPCWWRPAPCRARSAPCSPPAALGTLMTHVPRPATGAGRSASSASVAGGGGAVGLILGGILTEYLSWRWARTSTCLRGHRRDRRADRTSRAQPAEPAATGLRGDPTRLVGPVLHRLRLLARRDRSAGPRPDAGVAGPGRGAARGIRRVERGSPPCCRFGCSDRPRGGSYVAVGIAGIAIFGVFLLLTYYLQQVGYSPVPTGLAFLPTVRLHHVSSTPPDRDAAPVRSADPDHHRHGARRRRDVLPDSAHPDLLLRRRRAARADRHGPRLAWSWRRPINTATAGVDRADSGVASALVNTMQQVGGSIGTAALSTIALHRDDQLPGRPPHWPTRRGHRGHPRLYRGLRRVGGPVRPRRRARYRPAAVQAAPAAAQAGSQRGRRRAVRRGRRRAARTGLKHQPR